MDYQIALPPELGVQPADFAAAWNAAPAARAVAEARVGQARSFDPALGAAVELLIALASGVAGNALYDLIKEVLSRQGVRRRTRIVELERPGGDRLLVITIEED